MITTSYKLSKDLIARTATMLNWNLQKVPSSIEIINKEGRKVNGKSLVGILSGQFRKNDEIKIIIGNIKDLNLAKSYFNEVGKEI